MSFFSRRSKSEEGPGDPADFWAWWAESGRSLLTASRLQGDPAGTVEPLADAVARLHPDLSFEVAPGSLSAYTLVVTAAGNPDLRASARRWLLASPPSDETWTYSDQRLPTPDPESLTLPSATGEDVDFARIQVTARAVRDHFDVVLHHPRFADLVEPARLQVAFLALDLTLGEYDVELWVGEIRTSEHPLMDGFGLSALRAVVADLAASKVDEDGQPAWALLTGETTDGDPVLAAVAVPLHPVTAPHLSVHAALSLPYTDRTPEGLPDTTSLDALRGFEDRLGGLLGPAGRVVAHQSSSGVRVLHLYLDEATDALDRMRSAASDWPEGQADLAAVLDPQWQGVQHLRG